VTGELARELTDRYEIGRLLATFCARIDEYDMDAVAGVFTEDCEVDYGPGRGGPRFGRGQVRDRIAEGQRGFRRTHHQLGQSIVELHGDQAHAMTYVTAWHEEHDGSVSEARLRYLDDLRRGPDGWLIARRRVLASGVVGFPGVPWNWVPRREP
jgi:hypothetical protein